MRKAGSVWLLLFLLIFIFPLAAQEKEPESEPDSEPDTEMPEIIWDSYIPDLYRAGDVLLNISAGIIFPTVFAGEVEGWGSSNIKLGGVGSLGVTYFFSPNWFLGGELRGSFAQTRAENMLFMVSIGPFVGYQFVVGRFEIPIRFMTGISPQTYIGKEYLGWIINPGASVYYRFNPDWSFGLNLQWWFLPQWPENKKNVYANFLEISLSARYHF